MALNALPAAGGITGQLSTSMGIAGVRRDRQPGLRARKG